MSVDFGADMIKISNLQYTYKTKNGKSIEALKGIDLEVNKGEFVVFLGLNGSGKSTLIKHINGLLIPSGGDVVVGGVNTKDCNSIWQIRQKVGLVFQNPDNQIITNVVEEDVAFGPENLGLPSDEIKGRVKKALTYTKISEYSKHEPHLLSGGQKQKVAIAGILAMDPEYLVLDEPTSMLDSSGRKEVLEIIYDLNKNRKTTVLLATHSIAEAISADRIYVLDSGKIVYQGKPEKLLADVNLLDRLQIKPLSITSLAFSLIEAGIDISSSVLTVDEMVEALCLLK